MVGLGREIMGEREREREREREGSMTNRKYNYSWGYTKENYRKK